MIKKNIFLFFTYCILLHPVFSQGEILLKVETDTNIIRIGEQINLNVHLTQPENMNVVFPFLSDEIDPKIELLDISSIDTVKKSGNMVDLLQSYTLTSFDTGFYVIPQLPFEINFGTKKDTLFSYEIPLLVLSVPLDTSNNIYDIKPQYAMNFKISELLTNKWFYIGLGIILIAIIIFIIIKFVKTKEEDFIPQKLREPAHVIALRELDKLKNEKLWQQNKTKEYYTRLTEIIRQYIELRFGIMALEKTSTEILEEFEEKKPIEKKLLDHLRQLLNMADLIKFAKGSALPDENEKNMESTYDFVRKTKKVVSVMDDKKELENESKENNVEPVKEEKNDA